MTGTECTRGAKSCRTPQSITFRPMPCWRARTLTAAPPALGERLYDYLVARAQATHPVVQTGRFAADMKVHLVNDGPITIPLRMIA